MGIECYTFTNTELEDVADAVKASILQELTRGEEPLLSIEQADQWAADHTVIYRTKSFFRTITQWWNNEAGSSDGAFPIVVRKRPTSKPEKSDD